MKVFGIKPVVEALRAGRVTALTISTQRRIGLGELLQLAGRSTFSGSWL